MKQQQEEEEVILTFQLAALHQVPHYAHRYWHNYTAS